MRYINGEFKCNISLLGFSIPVYIIVNVAYVKALGASSSTLELVHDILLTYQ